MSGRLEGKTAVVTGSGSGIGRAIALGLAAEGARVCVSDLNAVTAEAVAKELPTESFAIPCDVRDTSAIDSMVDEAVSKLGRLDILVNNAGLAARGWVTHMPDEDWNAVMEINARGTFACSRAALKHMITQRSGRIVNTASGAGMRPFPGAAVYGASKAAVISLTQSLAQEVARYGITVNAIGPGVTDTPFWRRFRSEEQIEEALASGEVGKPEDFVPIVLFLCSDEGAVHTGMMINRETHMHAINQMPENEG